MLIFGLVLVVLSMAGAVVLIAYNSSGGPEQMIVLFGRDLVSINPLQAFVAGLVVAMVFALGLWMVVTTERRRRVARTRFRDARREARAANRQARTATRERDKLAGELERERTSGPVWTPPPDTPAKRPVAEPVASRTEPVDPPAAPERGFGRHFRRPPRTEAETTNEKSTT